MDTHRKRKEYMEKTLRLVTSADVIIQVRRVKVSVVIIDCQRCETGSDPLKNTVPQLSLEIVEREALVTSYQA